MFTTSLQQNAHPKPLGYKLTSAMQGGCKKERKKRKKVIGMSGQGLRLAGNGIGLPGGAFVGGGHSFMHFYDKHYAKPLMSKIQQKYPHHMQGSGLGDTIKAKLAGLWPHFSQSRVPGYASQLSSEIMSRLGINDPQARQAIQGMVESGTRRLVGGNMKGSHLKGGNFLKKVSNFVKNTYNTVDSWAKAHPSQWNAIKNVGKSALAALA